MPGFVTHYISGINTFKLLGECAAKENIRNNNCAFSLGLQGPDLFFYFIPASLNILPNVANLMHKEKVNLCFENMIRDIRFIREERSFQTVAAYVLGFMGHYLLDSSMHPYVYSRVGISTSNKTMGEHFGLESDIDREVLMTYKKMRAADFSHASVIDLTPREVNDISLFLCKVVNDTYDAGISVGYVKSAIACFRKESALLSDKSQLKHAAVNFVEKHIIGYDIFSPLLINEVEHSADPCNNAHKSWCNPWDDRIVHTESVYDLLEKMSVRYALFIPSMYDSLENSFQLLPEKEPRILKELGNLSYTSGLECTRLIKRAP